jgi:RNA polymerase sigma-70 factor (ECF subfamily)
MVGAKRAFLAGLHRPCWLNGDCVRCTGTISTFEFRIDNEAAMTDELDFESLVTRYYQALYQFAYSLTQSEPDACDLTQQTFYTWAAKGHQLRDRSKVKTWLFSTLHHEFLNSRRRHKNFPHFELTVLENELPVITPEMANKIDSGHVLAALSRIDVVYQAPVALFYLDDSSYKEIAEILKVPIGTVKSRISRGLDQLYRYLASPQKKVEERPS